MNKDQLAIKKLLKIPVEFSRNELISHLFKMEACDFFFLNQYNEEKNSNFKPSIDLGSSQINFNNNSLKFRLKSDTSSFFQITSFGKGVLGLKTFSKEPEFIFSVLAFLNEKLKEPVLFFSNPLTLDLSKLGIHFNTLADLVGEKISLIHPKCEAPERDLASFSYFVSNKRLPWCFKFSKRMVGKILAKNDKILNHFILKNLEKYLNSDKVMNQGKGVAIDSLNEMVKHLPDQFSGTNDFNTFVKEWAIFLEIDEKEISQRIVRANDRY